MGVYIKGMEIPHDCDECKLCAFIPVGDYGINRKCMPLNAKAEISIRRSDCPLVPVPPHGRLIDADELAQQYVTVQEQRKNDKTDYCNAFMNNGEPCTEWWCVEDMLENAPTIIPASGGKEDE